MYVMWYKVVLKFVESYIIVCVDLCGYGDSFKFLINDGYEFYFKCVMVCDQVEVMWVFGFEWFVVVGYDCGGCCVYCMVFDYLE